MIDQVHFAREGFRFEEVCKEYLKRCGFHIMQSAVWRYGVEIDIIAYNSSGTEMWFECKGVTRTRKRARGRQPHGLQQTDRVRSVHSNAASLRSRYPEHPPYIVLTSHMPQRQSVAYRLLRDIRTAGLLQGVVVVPLLQVESQASLFDVCS